MIFFYPIFYFLCIIACILYLFLVYFWGFGGNEFVVLPDMFVSDRVAKVALTWLCIPFPLSQSCGYYNPT